MRIWDPPAEIGLLLYLDIASATVRGLTDLFAVFRSDRDRGLMSAARSARCPVLLFDHRNPPVHFRPISAGWAAVTENRCGLTAVSWVGRRDDCGFGSVGDIQTDPLPASSTVIPIPGSFGGIMPPRFSGLVATTQAAIARFVPGATAMGGYRHDLPRPPLDPFGRPRRPRRIEGQSSVTLEMQRAPKAQINCVAAAGATRDAVQFRVGDVLRRDAKIEELDGS
jgi:hypothetical protein